MDPTSPAPASISTVIPAFNAASLVGAAIESALSQSVPPLEVIVVDDGSEDDTAAAAARVDPRVRVIQQPNRGPAAARNAGIRAARGEWIALLDADDTWFPERLAAQLPFMADPSVGMVHGRVTLYRGQVAPAVVTLEHLLRRNCIIASSASIRRACLDEVGGFDEARDLIGVEDYNLWLRIALTRWRIATCPQWLVRYTQAATSLSRNRHRILAAELFNVRHLEDGQHLTGDVTERMTMRLLDSYGEEFLHRRDLTAARACFRRLFLLEPSTGSLMRLLAAWLPRSLLDLRRRAVGR